MFQVLFALKSLFFRVRITNLLINFTILFVHTMLHYIKAVAVYEYLQRIIVGSNLYVDQY